MGELPTENTSVLTVFEYYDINIVKKKFQDNESVNIGQICYKDGVVCGEESCRLVTYDDIVIENYLPSLGGRWIAEESLPECDGVPAVVTAGLGLEAGDLSSIAIAEDYAITIIVQGVLER